MLLAIFNVCSNTAFSYNLDVPNLDPRNYDYLQEDQNTTAHLLEEINFGTHIQFLTKNDLVSGSGIISGKWHFSKGLAEKNILNYNFIRDKKDSLKIYIFPFHFFW